MARDGSTGSDVTIGDATLSRIGSMVSDDGKSLIKLEQAFFLPDDEQLHFAVLNPDGTLNTHPDIHVGPQSDGSLAVTVGNMTLAAKVDNNITHETYLASEQHDTDTPLVYLLKGETLHVEVAGSANNVNTLHFVRFDVDPNTGIASVGGVAYGNTDAFRAAVQQNWDQGIAVQNGHGTFDVTGKLDGCRQVGLLCARAGHPERRYLRGRNGQCRRARACPGIWPEHLRLRGSARRPAQRLRLQ